MTTNQTIDGVPRELLESFARDAAYSPNAIMRLRAEQARALLDAKPETVAGHHPACRAVDDYKPGACSHDCNPAAQHQGEPSHWANLAGQTITADLKTYNLKLGGAPAAACAAYSIPLYRHQAAQPHGEPVLYVARDSIDDLECDGMHATRKPNELQCVALYAEQPAPVATIALIVQAIHDIPEFPGITGIQIRQLAERLNVKSR